MTENPGGVESFLINYYRHIDRSRVQFDFLCNSYEKVAYEDELKKLGGRCFHIIARSKNPVRYKEQLNKVFAKHHGEWNTVWVNVCSLANIDYLVIAKKYGIKRRIIHSHNSENMDSALRKVLHELNKRRIGKYATDFWACSEAAADWFYQGEMRKKVLIIKNAIDARAMAFDANEGRQIREKLHADDKFVIGNVGRLHFQKNQSFAIDVFYRYHQINENSVLVFVGQGEDLHKLKDKVRRLHIEKDVLFVGVRKNIRAWLSAFDVFLFPSKFEGLSISAMEAQANGLPVIASDKVIPPEVKITDHFTFLSLEDGVDRWVKELVKCQSLTREDSESIMESFKAKGFDISQEAYRLEDLLLGR